MKKSLLLLFPMLTACGLLASCQPKSREKIELKRQKGLTSYLQLSSAELDKKIAEKDDFVLFIHSESCLSCQAFSAILKSYISTTGAMIYMISTSEAEQNSSVIFRITPTLNIFEDGKLVDKTDYEDGTLSTSEKFKSYLDKHAYLSSRIRVTEEQLDALIAGDESFLVEYSWDLCGDCKTMDKLFFDRFRMDNPTFELYEFELGKYFEEREDSSDPLWTAMAEKYHLSQAGSSKFGWKNGVVPTFQLYEGGTLKDAVVVYNDVLERVTDENGDIVSVKVSDSYFEDAPHQGRTFTSKGDDSAYSVYQKETADFYKDKLTSLFKNIY